MKDNKYPRFERRLNEGVSMVTKRIDEFGDEQETRNHLSDRTAKRLKRELDWAVGVRNGR